MYPYWVKAVINYTTNFIIESSSLVFFRTKYIIRGAPISQRRVDKLDWIIVPRFPLKGNICYTLELFYHTAKGFWLAFQPIISYYKSRLITTKQKKPCFVPFLVFVGCLERTAHFDARPKTMHSKGMFPVYGSQSIHANIANHWKWLNIY